jgi:osmotically-inducible protein OsmY
MKIAQRLVIPVVVAGTAVLAACTREQQSDAAQAGRDLGQAATQATAAAAAKAKDAAITAAVNGALVADTSLSALRIDVDTVGGRVTLRGTAPDAAARDRAAQLARNVDGVLTVDNQLQVQPGR